MSEEINVNNFIAVGNDEPCPFCIAEGDRLVEDVFINCENKDIVEHIMEEHPSELNKLFSSPPPKPWLEEPFQLLLAKLYVRLKVLNDDEKVPHTTFEDTMHAVYVDLKEFFERESDWVYPLYKP